MIIKPKVRGFVCITAHPEGCAAHVREQIATVKSQGSLSTGPKKVLIIGASTGYGLSSRIVSAFGCGAATLGVFFERPSDGGKPASAGWYNTAALQSEARAAGLWAKSVNGDAFSDSVKAEVIDIIKKELGKVDQVIYSLASPRRTDPVTGEVYKSTLKPIGRSFTGKTLDTDRKLVTEVTLESATDEEIHGTVKVMGGEDWELWMEALHSAGVLAEGVTSVAYDYIGPEVTWPIYKDGTIGRAKQHINASAKRIDALLKLYRGQASMSVNKAVVTQASSAIPVVPLYISILFKVMKEKGLHEGCIEQMYRLYKTQLTAPYLTLDDQGRIRIDDWEMRPDVQAAVAAIWPQVNTENLDTLTDFASYTPEFLKLFGFGLAGVNYDAEVDPVVQL
ncbi:MAG: enoyl-ACP reductase FabV [Verrucomicrobiota bacterium]|nr:enoyl-ACP reductase FabV [Verrucomicrobiota bacterium]